MKQQQVVKHPTTPKPVEVDTRTPQGKVLPW